jgi:SagB-type dehydrogenase family enzyme
MSTTATNTSLQLSSQTLGERFAEDPELRLPEFPRLPPELLQLPLGPTSLLFEGARGTQVVGGKSARTVLPQVLPLLDGKHDMAALQRELPQLSAKALRDIVTLLFSRGLLEDGCVEGPATPLSSFAGRYNDVTRVNRHRGEAVGRLAKAKVIVGGSARASMLAMAALQGQGLGELRQVSRPEELTADTTLLVAAFEGGSKDDASAWFAAAHALGIKALHAHVASDAVEIGPLYIPGVSGCHECFRELRPAPTGGTADDLGFWMGVLGLHAMNVVSRIGPVKLFNTARVHLRTPQGRFYEKARLARLPGCPHCGLEGAGPSVHEPAGKVWLLHNAAHGITCQELRNPRDHQIHYAATNIRLTQEPPKAWYGTRTLALPEVERVGAPPPWLSEPPPFHEHRPDVQALSAWLRFSAGYQQVDGAARRIAASGGGLGASEIMVVARKVQGLPRAVYHYDGLRHQLDQLTEASDELLAGALGIPVNELPPALLVQVSEMTRLRQKYDKFAFRLGSLDAGATQAWLHEVGDALGWRLREYAGLRDKAMAHALQLVVAGHRHMVAHAVGWGEPFGVQEPPDLSLHHHQYPDTLIEWSAQLGHVGLQQAPATRPRGRTPMLPPAGVSDLAQLLLSRRSIRRFDPRPLPGRVVQAIAALADEVNSLRTARGGLALRMGLWAVLTRDTESLESGLYRWHDDGLRLVRSGLSLAQIESLGQQKGFAQAPLILLITGDFEHAVTQFGGRGYREMLMRAGAMLGRAQIVAGSWQVSACMWGGIAEEAWGQVLGIDRYRDCPLFAASFGQAIGGSHE